MVSSIIWVDYTYLMSVNFIKTLYKRVMTLLPPDTQGRMEPLSWLAAIIGGHTWQGLSQSMSKDVTNVSTIERMFIQEHKSILKRCQKDLGS